jgi:hypothetical protein
VRRSRDGSEIIEADLEEFKAAVKKRLVELATPPLPPIPPPRRSLPIHQFRYDR